MARRLKYPSLFEKNAIVPKKQQILEVENIELVSAWTDASGQKGVAGGGGGLGPGSF